MNKYLTAVVIVFFAISNGFSQSSDLEKRKNKVDALVEKNKIEKASEKLEAILADYSYYGEGWDLLSQIRQKEWQDSKNIGSVIGGSYTITVKGGADADSEELASSLASLLNGISPSLAAHKKYINTLRMATLKCNTAYYSSILLRNEKVIENVDTNISEKAIGFYNEGEKEFQNRNFYKAAQNYQKAVDEQPNFYKARLYLGDSYYFTEDYIEAIKKFKLVKENFPQMLEPRKYLVDAYAKEGLYPNCLEEAIEAFTVYPDLSMYAKLTDAVSYNDKKIDMKWTPRGCFPNSINNNSPELIEDENNVWFYYQTSKNKIKIFCDESGKVTKANGLTQSQYMEVYSWEQMIENSKEDELLEAKKMQKLGYLDCYVLVTCFHQDLYEQYLDFASNNEKKIIQYFNAFIE